MSKPSAKKDKVPKITEEEYVAYLTSLRELTATEDVEEGKTDAPFTKTE